jgi:hypothetical protein
MSRLMQPAAPANMASPYPGGLLDFLAPQNKQTRRDRRIPNGKLLTELPPKQGAVCGKWHKLGCETVQGVPRAQLDRALNISVTDGRQSCTYTWESPPSVSMIKGCLGDGTSDGPSGGTNWDPKRLFFEGARIWYAIRQMAQ